MRHTVQVFCVSCITKFLEKTICPFPLPEKGFPDPAIWKISCWDEQPHNWSDIVYGHIMKALDSFVTLWEEIWQWWSTLKYTYVDMKVWSRIFPVKVPGVSARQIDCSLIAWYTCTSETLAAVFCAKGFKYKQKRFMTPYALLNNMSWTVLWYSVFKLKWTTLF